MQLLKTVPLVSISLILTLLHRWIFWDSEILLGRLRINSSQIVLRAISNSTIIVKISHERTRRSNTPLFTVQQYSTESKSLPIITQTS